MSRLLAAVALCLAAVFFAASAPAQQRLPTIPPDQYTPEQKKAAEEFLAARKVPVFGPFEPMMHSPEVMSMARSMGDYLRYHSALGNTLSELAILITARHVAQPYEWAMHAPVALKEGLPADIIEHVRSRADLSKLPARYVRAALIVQHVLARESVPQALQDATEQEVGVTGLVELVVLAGYYQTIAAVLFAFDVPLPVGTPAPF